MVAAMSSDARSRARQYYEGSGRSLGADVAALAANPQGVVVLLPQLVVLMKAVKRTCPQHWQELDSSPHGADAWYVHLLVGDLSLAQELARGLHAFPWLCFQRGARSAALHQWSWARFVSALPHDKPENITTHMGFKNMFKTPSAAAPATVKTPPPTVTETLESDTQEDYNQRASRRKGLLSTILSNHNRSRQDNGSAGNTTLG